MSQQPLSKRDFALIQETAYFAQHLTDPSQLHPLMKWVSSFVPSEYAACGHFSFAPEDTPGLGFSTYNQEFCSLYMQQALITDPAVVRLATTSFGTVSSVDDPTIEEPRQVVGLKIDCGIQTCHSIAIRGAYTPSLYMAFSNFDRKQQDKLSQYLTIIGPSIYLAYMRVKAKRREPVVRPALTAREVEIMKWVQEGKTNWEISRILKLSLNTVKFHMKNILNKLGVENRWAALAECNSWMNQLLIPSPLRESASVPRAHSDTEPSA